MELKVGLFVSSPLVNSCWKTCSRPGILHEITTIFCHQFNISCRYFDINAENSSNDMFSILTYINNGIYNTSLPHFAATPDRLKDIDFSQVLFHNQIILATRMPPLSKLTLSQITILNWKVWLCLLASTIIIGILLISSEGIQKRNISQSPIFKMFDLIYLFLNQAQRQTLPSLSYRLLILFWAVFALIISAIYSGNLLMNLLKPQRLYPFTDFESFAVCIETKRCKLVSQSSATSYINQLYNSNIASFQQISKALSANPLVVIPNVDDILYKILHDDNYFIVWMTKEMRFNAVTNGNPDCSFIAVDSGITDTNQFPTQKNSDLLKIINSFIKDFRGSGIYSRIYNKYIKHNDLCMNNNVFPKHQPLTVSTGYSLLFIISIGSLFSIVGFLLEIAVYKQFCA